MISKMLDDSSQWENLFHTKCLIKGSVCSLIIDIGHCANIASASMVDHLKFPTTPHENPYRLQWLKDCGELKVTHQVAIWFKVGNDEDEVLCNIIPLQACNILLVRL